MYSRCLKIMVIAVMTVFIAAQNSRAEEQGGNLSLADGVTVTANSIYMKYAAKNVVDGNDSDMNSRWVSEKITTERIITIDFGKEVEIGKVVYKFWTDKTAPVEYDVLVKKGDKWEKVVSVTEGKGKVQSFDFDKIKTTALRTVFKKGGSDDHIRVYEIETYK